jgi:hypothetical protein
MLFMVLNLIDGRKIDPAFTIIAATLLHKQASINKPAKIKHCCYKQNSYYYYLDIHVTNLLQFNYIRIDKRNSIWFDRELIYNNLTN